MKDKSLNVPVTVDIARYATPWKITKHKCDRQSSVFFINQIKITYSITYSTENDIFNGQSRWPFI